MALLGPILAATCILLAQPSADAQTGGIGVALTFNDYYNYGNGSLTPFDLQTGATLPSVAVQSPTAVVLTADDRTAWVLSAGADDLGSSGSVVPVDLTTSPPTAGSPVTLAGAVNDPGTVNDMCGPFSHRELDGLALTPDGHMLYAVDAQTDTVYPVDVTQTPARPLSPITLASGAHPAAIVISSDGGTAYVADAGSDSVSVLSLATGTVQGQIALAAGSAPDALALAPDGHTLYVAEAGRGAVVPVALPAQTVGPEISTGGTPNGLVVTPDGSHVYATIDQADRCLSAAIPASGGRGVVPIATSTGHAGTPIGTGHYSYPALSADGTTAYVTDGRQDVQPINLPTGKTEPLIAPIDDVHGIAIGGSAPPVTGSGAAVAGTVRNGAAGGSAVASARVELCATSGSQRCLTEVSGRDGGFSFTGIAAGSYTLAAWPSVTSGSGSGLFERTDRVVLHTGRRLAHDLVLRALDPLSNGVTVSGPGGTASDGVPLEFASNPFTVRVPLHPAPHGQPNTRRVYGAVFQLSSDIGINAVDVAMFEVRYGADGRPASISELMEGPGRASTPTSAAERSSLERSQSRTGSDEVQPLCHPRDVFSIRPDDPGGVELRINGFGSPLSFHFDPIALPTPEPTGNAAVDITAGGLVAVANAGIEEVPGVAEYNGLIYGLNIAANLAQHNYAQAASNTYFNFLLPRLGSSVSHGPVQMAAWEFGAGVTQNNVDSALTPAPDESCSLDRIGADLYIDPSGRVLTAGGHPLAGAHVVLTRSGTRSGHQLRVPAGSPVMSPANRRNPDRTNAAGMFGWDVLAGFYQVRASHPGCTGPGHRSYVVSPVLQIPPAAVNLVLRLRCPKLVFAPARVQLHDRTVKLGRGKQATVLSVHVTGAKAGKVPTGTVTFLAHRRTVGVLALVGGRATLTRAGKLRRPVVAKYTGDGRYRSATGSAGH